MEVCHEHRRASLKGFPLAMFGVIIWTSKSDNDKIITDKKWINDNPQIQREATYAGAYVCVRWRETVGGRQKGKLWLSEAHYSLSLQASTVSWGGTDRIERPPFCELLGSISFYIFLFLFLLSFIKHSSYTCQALKILLLTPKRMVLLH